MKRATKSREASEIDHEAKPRSVPIPLAPFLKSDQCHIQLRSAKHLCLSAVGKPQDSVSHLIVGENQESSSDRLSTQTVVVQERAL